MRGVGLRIVLDVVGNVFDHWLRWWFRRSRSGLGVREPREVSREAGERRRYHSSNFAGARRSRPARLYVGTLTGVNRARSAW